MSAWNGSGHDPGFTLSDDEVLAFVSANNMQIEPGDPRLVPALTVWRKLQQRAEDIINEQQTVRPGGPVE